MEKKPYEPSLEEIKKKCKEIRKEKFNKHWKKYIPKMYKFKMFRGEPYFEEV